ncbi:MAG: exonuclease domain-containing protein [Clostridiales bacterium]|nr:exonuclease domain-containing protein [Clostridiales bacterium]
MFYVIMDLEWNNTYGRKTKSFINEIIEIGAVMLDGDLNEVSRFSCFIKSQIGKKLRGSVKELTHITNEDIRAGTPFTKAFADFRRWIGQRENVIVTWGDGDIRVLIENYRYLNGIETIPFLSNYSDVQRYFQHVMKTSPAHQVGLGDAAEMLGINVENYSQHRAIDDSLLTVDLFKKIFDPAVFPEFIKACDKSFYAKLSYKPYYIKDISSPLVDRSKLSYKCGQCGEDAERITDWKFNNRCFRAIYYCKKCDIKTRVSVSFKKYFDRVEVKKTSVTVEEQKPENGDPESVETLPETVN